MTMPAPKGAFSCGGSAIADKLIQCDWFEKFTKEPIEADRRARIYLNKVPAIQGPNDEIIGFDDLIDQRPFACIWPAQPAGRFASRIAAGTSSVSLDYFVYFEAEDSDAVLDDPLIDPTKDEEQFSWWVNMIGVLLGGHPDDISPIVGLIDLENFALNEISAVDMMHITQEESGMSTYFQAIALLQTGAQV